MNNLDKLVDIQTLKRPLGQLCLALVISTGLAISSYWFKSTHAKTRNQNFERLQSLQDTENKTRESGRIYKNFYGRYKDLKKIGFIGNERRLLWIETLRHASSEQNLFGIEYNISEQRPYNGHLFVDQEQYIVQQSAMDIKLGLSHEGKLLAFLEQLEFGENGLFDIQECTLTPKFGQTGIKPWDTNVTADCRLNWYTLKPNMTDTNIL